MERTSSASPASPPRLQSPQAPFPAFPSWLTEVVGVPRQGDGAAAGAHRTSSGDALHKFHTHISTRVQKKQQVIPKIHPPAALPRSGSREPPPPRDPPREEMDGRGAARVAGLLRARLPEVGLEEVPNIPGREGRWFHIRVPN